YANAGVPHLPVNIGTWIGIFAVECYGIKGRRQPRRRHALAQIVKSLICALGRTLTGKHARGIFALSLEWKNTGREGIVARQIFCKGKFELSPFIFRFSQCNPRNLQSAERFPKHLILKRSIPYLYIHILLAILFIQFVPAFQNLFTARIEFTEPMIAHLGKLVLKLFTSLRLPSIHLLQCPFHLTKPPGYLLLIFGPAVIIADRFRNLRQIALPLAGNNSLRLNIFGRLGIGVPTGFPAQAIMTVNLIYQSL